MADGSNTIPSNDVSIRDVMPVMSRVRWGPIFAGAAVALAVYWLLALLGAAIGLSVSDHVGGVHLTAGAAVWAVICVCVSLFAGGCAVSQLSVGETKGEAVMYGVILWGVLFAALMWLMTIGVEAGYSAMVGLTRVGGTVAQNSNPSGWQALARQAGVPQEQINQWQQQAQNAPAAAARQAANNPQNQHVIAEAAWWAFGATLLSILAAILGTLVGSGPSFRLVPLGAVPASPAIQPTMATP